MSGKLPEHVVKQHGSSRAFRAAKRTALRNLEAALNELRIGCAYFPSGGVAVSRIDYEVKILKRELSVKNWGR